MVLKFTVLSRHISVSVWLGCNYCNTGIARIVEVEQCLKQEKLVLLTSVVPEYHM